LKKCFFFSFIIEKNVSYQGTTGISSIVNSKYIILFGSGSGFAINFGFRSGPGFAFGCPTHPSQYLSSKKSLSSPEDKYIPSNDLNYKN
jgi:hypothetical protein